MDKRGLNLRQRGITVSIFSGPSEKPTDSTYEFQDPEAWAPILTRGARNGQHARSKPEHLQYRVWFGFSDEEYTYMNRDTVCIDSPVFDDITITY
ncbi:MAG: hypothetical protein ACK2UH_10595, partial [Candidatus Promineifilaceae bacterium]